MPLAPKLCIDCKHCTPGCPISGPTSGYVCKAPESAVVNLVTGAVNPRDCENARTWHLCGADGKFFEPKEGAK